MTEKQMVCEGFRDRETAEGSGYFLRKGTVPALLTGDWSAEMRTAQTASGRGQRPVQSGLGGLLMEFAKGFEAQSENLGLEAEEHGGVYVFLTAKGSGPHEILFTPQAPDAVLLVYRIAPGDSLTVRSGTLLFGSTGISVRAQPLPNVRHIDLMRTARAMLHLSGTGTVGMECRGGVVPTSLPAGGTLLVNPAQLLGFTEGVSLSPQLRYLSPNAGVYGLLAQNGTMAELDGGARGGTVYLSKAPYPEKREGPGTSE